MTNDPRSFNVEEALYSPQRIPSHQDNPLIAALPPILSEEEIFESLLRMPSFEAEQRQWSTPERINQLFELQNFMAPTLSQLELCIAVDGMMRNGYVGRAPNTPGHTEISMEHYRRQIEGATYKQSAHSMRPSLSTSLVGLSGMGKTTTLKRWFARLPKVIYHSKTNTFQVPVLIVEAPADGKSMKGLCHQILIALDELIPGADYFSEYARNGRTPSETLLSQVKLLMNLHSVGLIVVDEIQNLKNAAKGKEVLLTELVSANNTWSTPMLLVGTNKAASLLSTTFRQSRRSTGFGITPWDRLAAGSPEEPGEWDAFLGMLWEYQWVKKPIALTQALSLQLFDYSQGVIDLAIKLFAIAQGRAMLSGAEQITPDLLKEIYDRDFQLMHPMLAALRSGNVERLLDFDDIAPINLREHFNSLSRNMAVKRSPLHRLKPNDPTFIPRFTAALEAVGVDPEQAEALATDVAVANPDQTLAQGMANAVKKTYTAGKRRKGNTKKETEQYDITRFDHRPGDYRQAIAISQAEGGKILQRLIELGMAPQLEEILPLS